MHVRETSNDRHVFTVIQGNVLLHLVLPEKIVRSRLFNSTNTIASYHVIEMSVDYGNITRVEILIS